MSNKISVKSSSSPLGGGCVRVYVGDYVMWMKRTETLEDMLKVEAKVKETLANRNVAKAKGLRLV